jgi:hypothetical protein
MDRNIILVKNIIMGVFGIFTLSLGGCFSGNIPTKDDFVGVWKSQYDEILTLHQDSSFIMKNFRSEMLYRKSSEGNVNGKGTWHIKRENGIWHLYLHYSDYNVNEINIENGFNDVLYVRGSGFLGNTSPWKIHSWDEDDIDYSVFNKGKTLN